MAATPIVLSKPPTPPPNAPSRPFPNTTGVRIHLAGLSDVVEAEIEVKVGRNGTRPAPKKLLVGYLECLGVLREVRRPAESRLAVWRNMSGPVAATGFRVCYTLIGKIRESPDSQGLLIRSSIIVDDVRFPLIREHLCRLELLVR